MYRTITYFIFASLTFGFVAGCKPGGTSDNPHLGQLHFDVTGLPEAQPDFKEGLLLLHSFEYADAEEAFHKARTTDSTFVMAYWGEAMTCNHPLWQEQDVDKGKSILNALSPNPDDRIAKAKTELEKDFIRGVNILYGEGNKSTRYSLYAEYMKTMYEKYPGNDEVAAFYSLALNGWGTTDLDKSIMVHAAQIAQEILDRNPDHPGALHYMIHAYDDPQYAELAAATADRYAIVAPDAGHALHMPTHTYLALGQWDKVVQSNVVSWKAEYARKQRKNLDNNALAYHAYHWLEYGRLQLGEQDQARAMLDSMQTFCAELPSPRARAHLILLKSTYLAETNDYSSKAISIPVDPHDLNIVVRAKNYYTIGMAAYQAGEPGLLDTAIMQLADERVTEQLKTSGTGIRMCGNINRSLASPTDLLEAETMELELRALRAWMKKDAIATEDFLKKATATHDKAGYSYGPPNIVKPSYELYGEWLLENKRPKDALVQFDKSLVLAPNRRLSVIGKQMALKAI